MASSSLFAQLTAPNGVAYKQPLGLFINNEFVAAQSNQTIEAINPFDESVIARVHAAGAEDVDIAVQAARDAFDGPWGDVTSTERGRLLSRLADLVEAQAKTLATIESWDGGKPFHVALQEDVQEVIAVFRYYAGYSDKLHGQVIETEKEPACLHYPRTHRSWKLGPAIATGNCVVIKAAEQTPLSILYLATLFKEAGYPKGVVNVINGHGRDAGAALASHMGVDKIAFTGSTQTGREIMKLASGNLKSITLETGGKSPLVVFEDADLDKAAYWGHIGIIRIFVHEKIYDDFLRRFLEKGCLGQGPQVSQTQRDNILRYIELGKSEGATLALGGKVHETAGNGKGYFVEPTVFTNVNDDMAIYREEIFGPVAAVLSFQTEEEVVRRANDTFFGLGAALFTKDVSRVHRITRKIQSGTVWVNSSNNSDIRAPFGGFKQSGIGRECGQAGIEAYTNIKTVYITLD
ncbi:hypothetical protein CEP52_016211 [Fusarium oligoseptatum]|uniref:aldehyde dehydrogenase (NAD(+)) n=1 Tax=Fusarium oligoseptatum TaxID=2604345 RepID=A0A428S5V4_9HYPO|nr:hypothetical protein CEP52_016211 [Fusarium oligoseptatum]